MTDSPALCPQCGEMLQVYSPESGIQIGCPECLWLQPLDPIPDSTPAETDAFLDELTPDIENPRRD